MAEELGAAEGKRAVRVGVDGGVHRCLIGGGEGSGRGDGRGRGEVEDRGEGGVLLQHWDGALERPDLSRAESGVECERGFHGSSDEGVGAEGELGHHAHPRRPKGIRRTDEPGVQSQEEMPVLKSQESPNACFLKRL